MKCKKCNSKLEKVRVKIEGANYKIESYQCKKCEYFWFGRKKQKEILKELIKQDLKIRQKIIKLSKDRLGMYFNKHLINSLGLEAGEEIAITVPDKRHILISIENYVK